MAACTTQSLVCVGAGTYNITRVVTVRASTPKAGVGAACLPTSELRGLHAPRSTARPAPITRRLHVRAALPELISGGVGVPVMPVVGTLGISFMVYRAVVYSRIQYITAALLGNQTPRGASVLEIGVGGGKNLYYYPKGVSVIGVDPQVNQELLYRSAAEAGVVLDYRKGRAETLDLPSNSVDCVVSTYTLGAIPFATRTMAVQEISRVLKPGGRFLFVEMLRGACQGTLGIIEQQPGWEVDADQAWKTMFNDPHAIGVAIKKGALQVGEPDRAEQLEAKLKGGRRRNRK